MNTRLGRRLMLVLGIVGCAGLAAYMTSSAAANGAFRPSPPAAPVIATVDMEEVLKGMKEREDKEKVLQGKLDEYKNRVTALQEEIKNDQTKLQAEPDGPGKITKAKELREKIFRAEFEAQYSQKLVGEMRGEMLRELYTKLNDAARALAKQNGYQLVMTSDEKVPVSAGDPESVLRAIALKRMLYVDPAMDITQEIVTYLNNQFAAGGAVPKPTKRP